MPARRVCATPGCGELVTTRLCVEHKRAYSRSRPNTARGYNTAHWAERARLTAHMATHGPLPCARCHTPVDPHDWHLGHTDDRTAWTGPEHPRCNTSAAGRAAHTH